jgi:hypothetical protein
MDTSSHQDITDLELNFSSDLGGGFSLDLFIFLIQSCVSVNSLFLNVFLELFPHEDSELIDLAGEDLFSSFGPVSPLVSLVQLLFTFYSF